MRERRGREGEERNRERGCTQGEVLLRRPASDLHSSSRITEWQFGDVDLTADVEEGSRLLQHHPPQHYWECQEKRFRVSTLQTVVSAGNGRTDLSAKLRVAEAKELQLLQGLAQ